MQQMEDVMADRTEALELPSGHRIPVLGLGTWELRGADGLRAVEAALDMGYRHIDTAEMYENHDIVGQAIRGIERVELFITSKVLPDHLHYHQVIAACDTALLELELDYLDLFLIHWPNPELPMQQTFDALRHLYESGKVRDIGVSNFQQHRIRQAVKISPHPIANNQVELHPLLYQRELMELCREHSIAMTAYSPLARGRVFDDPTLREVGEKHDRTAAEVSLRWLLQKGCVVIPRSSREEHLRQNMTVFDWALSTTDIARIDAIGEQLRVVHPEHPEFEER